MQDIRVADTLPSGVDVVAVNAASDRISCTITSNVACTIDYLYSGDSVNVDIVVRPTTAKARTLKNTAEVSHRNYYGYNSPDPNTANNTSTATTEVSASYTPIPDTTHPETTLTQKPQALSRDASPSFSFKANEGPPTFECKLDTSDFQPCTSPKQYFMLSEGEHTFQVLATDPSGNVDPTPTEAYTWTVDSIGPKVTFTGKPAAVTSGTTPTWAWTVEDANLEPTATTCTLYDITNERNLFIQYNYTDPDFGGCASPFTFGGDLPDGDYYFKIFARDKLGNARTAYNYFEVDTVAPAAPVISSPAKNSYNTDGSITLRRTAEADATVEIFEGATLKGTATANDDGLWSKTVAGVANGSHTYAAKAIDQAGNPSATFSNARTVTVDTVRPMVVGTRPLEGATGVLVGTNVTATFSEAMTATTITGTTFMLVKKGTTTAIEAGVTYDPATKKATLNPNANLVAGATYKVTVTTWVKDLAGNQLDQDQNPSNGRQQKVWSFTVMN